MTFKDPFYFHNNNSVINLAKVTFNSSETGYGFNFGWLEGELNDKAVYDRIPSGKELIKISGANETFEVIPSKLLNSSCLSFYELCFLGAATKIGAVFRSEVSKRIISIPVSAETHYEVENALIVTFADSGIDEWEQRVATAYLNVGQMLNEGYGVDQDKRKAIDYYHRSAEMNNALANYILGALFRKEHGDEELSHRFFVRGAAFGDLNSKFNLAVDYYSGIGTEQDLEQSYYWANQVKESGDTEILQLIDSITDQLDERTISTILDKSYRPTLL